MVLLLVGVSGAEQWTQLCQESISWGEGLLRPGYQYNNNKPTGANK